MSNNKQKREKEADHGLNVWNFDSMQDSERAPANWLSCEEDGVPELYVRVLVMAKGVGHLWAARVPRTPGDSVDPGQYLWVVAGTNIVAPASAIRFWCFVSPCGRTEE